MPARKKSAMESVSPEGLRLTLDEIDEIEEILDCPASQWESARQGKMMKAMIWVLRKRSDPDASMDDVGKLCVTDLEEVLAPFVSDGTEAI
jgi:hypothetical protein